MKIQVALDFTNKRDALKVCKKVFKDIDIIELGTPLIKAEGIKLIKAFKKFKKPILADLKTMDTGFLEAEMAYKAGADIATICGASDDGTIKGAVKAKKKYKKKICVDLISVKDVRKRAKEAVKMGADYVIVHTGIDMQDKGMSPFKDLRKVSKVIPNKKICVAGGINEKSIRQLKNFNPEIIIVGGAITKSKNPDNVAKKLKEVMK